MSGGTGVNEAQILALAQQIAEQRGQGPWLAIPAPDREALMQTAALRLGLDRLPDRRFEKGPMTDHELTIEVPVLPTSYNETRYAPWQVARAKAKPFKDALILVLNVSKLPRPRQGKPPRIEYVEASAVLTFKDRRRRDEGNFRTPLEKTLGDVLTGRGYLADDTPDHYRFTTCELAPEPGKPVTTLTLKWREPNA